MDLIKSYHMMDMYGYVLWEFILIGTFMGLSWDFHGYLDGYPVMHIAMEPPIGIPEPVSSKGTGKCPK